MQPIASSRASDHGDGDEPRGADPSHVVTMSTTTLDFAPSLEPLVWRARYRERVSVGDLRDDDDEDAALARAWFDGREGAVRAAWERYGTLVHTFCLRALFDRDAAADCVQETFVSAWRSRDRFDPSRGTLAGWLVGIARHRVHDAYRARARTPEPRPMDPDDAAAAAEANGSSTLVERLLLSDALATLGERPRQVLELAFYGGLSQTEVAERMNLPLGTVKSDMRRALARLRKVLEGGVSDD
jgi:RNA polymerase sigma-70 factor (ECF subfamily)